MGRSGKLAVFGAAILTGCLGLASTSRAADSPVDFDAQIKPILKQSCVKCHSLDNPRKQAAGGLQLDVKEAALKGGKVGSDIVPGDSTKSLVYRLLLGKTSINGKPLDAMPKQKRGEEFKPLEKDQIDLIKAWIDQGATWPDATTTTPPK
jgi:cytochrome c